ncbi:MAG: PspC protein [Acidimicrobiales bacterium]|nr:PspC protein [Acidimicrobiales bacterium]
MVAVGQRTDDRTMPTTTAPPPPTEPSPSPNDANPPPFGRQRPPLRRSTTDRRIGGVAGGVAASLDLDPTLVRVVFAIVALASFGLAIAAYAAAWLLVPDDLGGEPIGLEWYRRHGASAAGIAALVVLTILGLASLRAVLDLSWGWHGPHAGVLVLFGIVGLVIAYRADPHGRTGHRLPHRHGGSGGPGGHVGSGGSDADPSADRPNSVDDDPTRVIGEASTRAEEPRTTTIVRPVDPEVLRQRRLHGRVRNATLLTAVVAGTSTAVLWATGAWSAGGWIVAAVVLGCLGAGLTAGPWVGWSWTLVIATLLALVGLAVSLVPGVSLRGGIGERVARPLSVSAAEAGTFRVGIGRQEVDLRGLALEPGSVTRVHAAVGMGTVDIRVPDDVDVVLRGHLSAGVVRLDGEDIDVRGTDVDLDRTFPAASASSSARGSAARIVVDVAAGFGDVQIEHTSVAGS